MLYEFIGDLKFNFCRPRKQFHFIALFCTLSICAARIIRSVCNIKKEKKNRIFHHPPTEKHKKCWTKEERWKRIHAMLPVFIVLSLRRICFFSRLIFSFYYWRLLCRMFRILFNVQPPVVFSHLHFNFIIFFNCRHQIKKKATQISLSHSHE